MAKYYFPHPDDIETFEELEEIWKEMRRAAFLYRIEQFMRSTAPGALFPNPDDHQMWKNKKKVYLKSLNPFYFCR